MLVGTYWPSLFTLTFRGRERPPPLMVHGSSRSWPSIFLGVVLGEALLILAFMFFFEPQVPLRWTVALSPFAAGLWVLMRLVADPLVPDAQPEAVDLLQLTTLLTAVFASAAAGYILLRGAGLV